MTRTRPTLAALAVVMGVLALPAGAHGNHSPGMFYNGTHAEGGNISFDLSGSDTLGSFGWSDLWGTSPSGGWCNSSLSTHFFFGAPPITNHEFNYSGSSFDAAGSFPTPGTASGTVTLHTEGPPPAGLRLPCTSGPVAWTASDGSTGVSPPPAAPTPGSFTFPNGATYVGTHPDGEIEFDVAVDGSQIIFIRFGGLQGTSPQTGSCSYTNTGQPFDPGEGPAINGGSWNYSNTDSFGNSFTFTGSFGTGPAASGTIGASFQSNQCTIGPVNWTAKSVPPPPDSDSDGVPDASDNCPTAFNTDQGNNDNDASGDVCDADDDNDGVADTADLCETVPATTANGCPASQGPDGDGDGDGDGGEDTTPPLVALGGPSKQKAGQTVAVVVACVNEACLVGATGTVNVPGAARVYRLRRAAAVIARGGKETVRLKVPKRVRRAIRRALRNRKRVRANVIVTVRDGAGNAIAKTRRIRLVA
jgi:hypothetical protein